MKKMHLILMFQKNSGVNDRSYNGDENLNEDCDDDVEEGGDAGLVDEEEEDCINDDHIQPTEDDAAEADVLSEDLTSDHVEVGGEEEHVDDSQVEGQEVYHQEENAPGASCDNSA